MKLNKMNKIIIPVVALAMGAALVGSVSSTLAWFQYSTKAQAAFIGTSVGYSENLEIQKSNGKWNSNLSNVDVNALAGVDGDYPNLLPVTPGATVAIDGAIPAKTAFKTGLETGVAAYRSDADSANIIQFDLKIRYKKTTDEPEYLAKYLKLIDLTIMNNAANTNGADLYKAIRVHFAIGDGDSYKLFANNNDSDATTLTTQTFGNLDTDNDGAYDKALGYQWENTGLVTYGVADSTETAHNVHAMDLANNPLLLGQLPSGNAGANGLNVKVTIWIEGWQKLADAPEGNYDLVTGQQQSSSMWDPESYVNQKFNVGLRFQADDTAD